MVGQRRPPVGPRVQLEPGFEERWPGSDRLASSCVVNLWLLSGLLDARSQAWARREGYSSVAAFNVLTVLHGATEPLLPSEIAERMLVSRPAITGLLDSLERAGQVRRTRHPRDRRMRLVEITARARQRIEASIRRLHVVERRLMAPLTPPDQARLLRILGRLQAAAEETGPALAP